MWELERSERQVGRVMVFVIILVLFLLILIALRTDHGQLQREFGPAGSIHLWTY